MEAKLLTILNRCIYNKSTEDYTAILKLIDSINDDNVKDLNIKFNDTSVYVSMFNSDYKLISLSFTDSNKLLFCLPDNVSKTYVIENSTIGQDCGYSIQYDEIKVLLNSDKSL